MENVVKEAPVTAEPEKEEAVKTEDVSGSQPVQAPGSKTDSELLLKSLQEEREKRRQLEERLQEVESSTQTDEVFSDEGKVLDAKFNKLQEELSALKANEAKREVLDKNPVLKDKWAEFESYRSLPENKGMNLKTAVKAFLIEKELTEPQRVGLEKTTGGPKTAPRTGMTAEEIKTLRETDYRRYQDLLMKDQIQI